MTLDSESIHDHATLVNKPDYRSFIFSDNTLEIRGYKEEDRTDLHDKNIQTGYSGCQDYEVSSDPFLYYTPNGRVGNIMEVDGFVAREALVCGREHITEYTTPHSESEESEKRNSYSDESLVDSELPKEDTLFQESNNVVKDIGIDRGVPSQNKCSIDYSEMNHNIMSYCFLNAGVKRTSESRNEKLDIVPSISNWLKNAVKVDCNEEVVKKCSSKNLMKECDLDDDEGDKISSDCSTKKTVNKKLLLVSDMGMNPYHTSLYYFNVHDGEQNFDKDPCEEEVFVNSMESSSTEVCDYNSVTCSEYELQNGSRIHECDSSMVPICREEEGTQSTLETVKMPKLDDETESSAGHLCSSISSAATYSSQIACPSFGHISVQSDDSTRSRHSFAFPIIPQEWNGSPVRMVKAEPRDLWKHRCWRIFVPCRKF